VERHALRQKRGKSIVIEPDRSGTEQTGRHCMRAVEHSEAESAGLNSASPKRLARPTAKFLDLYFSSFWKFRGAPCSDLSPGRR